ncbi:hypothetical protein [Actinokineospora terrae]|uniref:Uncharacterized protein n=1 Tax=Actinokineospora terrae TaxID=155974 RepID=A0A1H9WZL9_9PSEU|nr:hypothetical protein [Actinokineospora terrae]SES39241.1 hypothetical protein SAMN04487818_11246 [Actinokineospora terrae]
MSGEDRYVIHNLGNSVGGDIIQQYGSGNIGKQVTTGSGDAVLDKTHQAAPEHQQTVVVHGGDYVDRDKHATHVGDVNHGLHQRPGDPPGPWPQDRQ